MTDCSLTRVIRMPQEICSNEQIFPGGQTGEAKCNEDVKFKFADRSVLDKTDAE